MSSSQVSQFAGRNPTRGIGNAVAERIEHAFTKPTGWLDRFDHELKTTSKVKGEPVRSISPQERAMFELFASLPENTQDELFRAVEEKKEHYEELLEALLSERRTAE